MLKEYFVGAMSVTVFIVILLGVSHPKLKSVTSLGVGVLVICAILLPLVDIIKDIDIDKTLDGIFDGVDYTATDSAIELAFEDAVASYIAQKYGVTAECVKVRADGFDIGTLTAQRIYVTLSGEAILCDYKKIEEEIAVQFTAGGECEASVDFG